jgi:hypothetical protein
MATITAANSSFSLTVANLYPTAQSIQGYAADDAFTADAVDQAELVMGVDGQLSAGFIFTPTKMTVMIMPTSPSYSIFDTWRITQIANQEVFAGSGTIILPGIGMRYTLNNGYLTSGKPFPDVKKVLQAVPYIITWQSIISSPTGS